MSAANVSLVCEKSATCKYIFRLYQDVAQTVPVDLTGGAARLTVRPAKPDGTAIVTASTAGSYLTLSDADSGEITLNIPSATTANFSAGPAVYDLLIELSGVVDRVAEGVFDVRERVTA